MACENNQCNIIIPDIKTGDSWNGMEIEILNDDDSPKDLTGATILCQFRDRVGSYTPPVLTFATADNSILIPDPTNGKFNFVGRIINVKPTTYYFDIQITFGDGMVNSQLAGQWTVKPDVSRLP